MLKPPIIILSDESTEFTRKVVGAISIPLDVFIELEDWFVKYRLNNRLFAEIKWDKVRCEGKYFRCYLELINKVLSQPEIKFHCNSYGGEQYKASYALVRSISWKLSNYGYTDPVGILFDEKEGKEVDLTREYFSKDHKFHHEVLFCTESNSTIFNTMQITDLLCGCLAYKINCSSGEIDVQSLAKHKFIKEVEKMDSGLEMELTFSPMWKYGDDKKIQHFILG